MSILIKGMEMPTNEPLIVKINPDGSVSKLWRDVFLEYANCKAFPVPPHGALMDRDDFFAVCPELVDGYKRITDDLVIIPAEESE